MGMYGILTGGGDAPGLNAVIKAYALELLNAGYTVIGLRRGWEALVNNGGIPSTHYTPITIDLLESREYRNIELQGGTFLESSRTNPQEVPIDDDNKEDRTGVALENLINFEFDGHHGFDGLAVLGGEDTMKGAYLIDEKAQAKAKSPSMNGNKRLVIVGGPKTVDKDVPETEWTIGSETAVEVAGQSLSRLDTTASSHYRSYAEEIMGRKAGLLVLGAAIYQDGRFRDPAVMGHGFRALPPELFKYDKETHTLSKFGAEEFMAMIGVLLLEDVVRDGRAVIGMSEGIEFKVDDMLHILKKSAKAANDGYGHVQLTGEQRTKALVDYWKKLQKRLGAEPGDVLRYGQVPALTYQDLGYQARGAPPNETDRYFATKLGRVLAQWVMNNENNGNMAALQKNHVREEDSYSFGPVPFSEVGGRQSNLAIVSGGDLSRFIGIDPKDRVNFLRPTQAFVEYMARLVKYVRNAPDAEQVLDGVAYHRNLRDLAPTR